MGPSGAAGAASVPATRRHPFGSGVAPPRPHTGPVPDHPRPIPSLRESAVSVLPADVGVGSELAHAAVTRVMVVASVAVLVLVALAFTLAAG